MWFHHANGPLLRLCQKSKPPPPTHTHTSQPRRGGAQASNCPSSPLPPLLLYSHGGAQASNWLAKELQPLLDGGMRGKPKGADMRPVLTSCFQQVGQGGGDE